MDDKQAFYVESTDGRKFKMVIRGDLGKLSVAKIRRYLKNYGVPDNQEILAGSLLLEDDMLGEHFGLHNEGVLHLRDPTTKPDPLASMPSNEPAAAAGGGSWSSQKRPTSATSSPPTQVNSDFYAGPASRVNTTAAAVATRPSLEGQGAQQNASDLQRRLDAAMARNADLESQLAQARRSPAPAAAAKKGAAVSDDGLTNAKASLALLAERLQVSLQFDSNLTCVVGTDEDFSLLLTYDPATERLYLYSSLLTELPADPQVRMKLYEVLLEGSMLSREVCGGGIGVSTKNSVVVLTTSLPVKLCQPAALCEVMPSFVETLSRWRDLVKELVL